MPKQRNTLYCIYLAKTGLMVIWGGKIFGKVDIYLPLQHLLLI